jgi:CheY-like chemotaxis protein
MRGMASVRRGVHLIAVTDPASPAPVHDANALLSEIADGVGLVSDAGEILWMAPRLAALDAERLSLFATACAEAGRDIASQPRRARRRRFACGDSFYEVVVTPGAPGTLVGVLVDVTARQRIADRIEMVDALGAELLDLDAQIVNPLNVTERLDLLEGKVVEAMRQVMRGEPFEIRLRDRRTDQLEVVIGRGLEPLRIGDTIHARASGHGISGLVAASGTSFICSDPDHDERYLPGLPGARSSLTVPLLLKDRITGVINVESMREHAFDDADRIALETYGRYVAMALNILDMLIVERTTTSERVSTMLRDELTEPARRLREAATHVASGRLDGYEALELALESLEARIRSVTAGPQTVLGVDRVARDGSHDPAISGKRILVADDEAQIRETIRAILQSCGATVDIRADGAGAIDAVTSAASSQQPYDLVLSDIRMPDRNGYEVFRGTRESSPSTAVILMTGFGYDPNHAIVRAGQEGLAACLFKPFQAQVLLEEVRAALGAPADVPRDPS